MQDKLGTLANDCKEKLQKEAEEKYFEWWFCENPKVAKEIYREYLELIRKANEIASSLRSSQ